MAVQLAPLISARHPSQLYQCVAESVVVGGALWWLWRRPRAAGVLTFSFLILYGIGRVLTEFVRLPDAHLAVQRVGGFSRGQWFSMLMVAIGITALIALTLRTHRNRALPRFGRNSPGTR